MTSLPYLEIASDYILNSNSLIQFVDLLDFANT